MDALLKFIAAILAICLITFVAHLGMLKFGLQEGIRWIVLVLIVVLLVFFLRPYLWIF